MPEKLTGGDLVKFMREELWLSADASVVDITTDVGVDDYNAYLAFRQKKDGQGKVAWDVLFIAQLEKSTTKTGWSDSTQVLLRPGESRGFWTIVDNSKLDRESVREALGRSLYLL